MRGKFRDKVISVLLACTLVTGLSPMSAYAIEEAVSASPLLAGSLVTASDSDTFDVTIDVTYGQTEARSMLGMMNEWRQGDDAWAWNADNTEKVQYTDLAALQYDYELERIAMQRAAELAVHFDHQLPDGTADSSSMLGSYSAWAENIAAGQETAAAAFTSWQEADDNYSGQGHRRNMLTSDCTHVGIGHAIYNGTHYWVQVFGKTADGSAFDDNETEAIDSTETVAIEVAASVATTRTLAADPSSIEIDLGGGVGGSAGNNGYDRNGGNLA